MSGKKKLSYKEQQKLYDKSTNNIIAGIAAIFFVVITAVYPLFITYFKDDDGTVLTYFNITYQKTLFFSVATAIAASAVLLMLIFIKKSFIVKDYHIENEPVRKLSVPEWSLLAFILLAFISALAGSLNKNPMSKIFAVEGAVKDIVWFGVAGRYEGFISYLFYVLTFFIIARFYKPKETHFLVLAGSAIIVSLYGTLQFFGIDLLGLFPFDGFLNEHGVSSYGPISAYFKTTLGNINIVSAYSTFAVILFAALFAVSSKPKNIILARRIIFSGHFIFLNKTSKATPKTRRTPAMITNMPVSDGE
jgi:hypothetical protein